MLERKRKGFTVDSKVMIEAGLNRSKLTYRASSSKTYTYEELDKNYIKNIIRKYKREEGNCNPEQILSLQRELAYRELHLITKAKPYDPKKRRSLS